MRKLYYVPGLISLLGLPLLLFFCGPKEVIAPTCIRIRLPTDSQEDTGIIKTFSKGTIYKSLQNKKIITIDLDVMRFYEGNDLERYGFDRRKHFVTQEIERVKFTNDTATAPTVTKWDIFKLKAEKELANAFFILRGNYVYVIGFCLFILLPGITKIRVNLFCKM